MSIKKTIACLSVLTALAACNDTGSGYYDSRGNYHYSGANQDAYSADTSKNAPYKDNEDNFYVDHSAVRGDPAKVSGYRRDIDPEVSPYKRSGYYDSHGYYIAANSGPNIPRAYFPKKGQCRVWFIDRQPSEQPPIESCNGIQMRVPDGAYVVYGG